MQFYQHTVLRMLLVALLKLKQTPVLDEQLPVLKNNLMHEREFNKFRQKYNTVDVTKRV